MKEWYSGAELAGMPGMPGTDRAVRDAAKRGCWRTRQRVGRGGGVEYHIASLPPETQAYLYAQAGATPPATPATPATLAAPETSSLAPDNAGLSVAPARADGPLSSPHPSTSRPPAARADARVIAFPGRGQAADPPTNPGALLNPTPVSAPDEAPVSVPPLTPVRPPAAVTPTAALPAPGPIPGLDELQQWTAARALRLTLKDLQNDDVKARLAVATAMENAPWQGKERVLKQLAEQHAVSTQTIRRWCHEVERWRVTSRLPTLQMFDTAIPLPRSRAFTQDAVAAGITLYAQAMRRGRRAAYADLTEQARLRGWTIGDYSSYTRLLAKVPPRLWDYIRQGATGFELGVTPKILRAWLSVPVYSVLCGDQNLPDYEILEPSTGEVYGPQLYLWMDCTSRAWTGLWPAYGAYSRYTVGASLREACRLATPGELFTDWGKPETSHYTAQIVAGLNGHCACGDWGDYAGRYAAVDALDALDAAEAAEATSHRLTTRVGIPWQKPIENQFSLLKQDLLDLDLPGFRQRQAGAWENDVEQARLARERKGGRLLTTEQFFEILRDVAERHNREAMHLRERETPIIPQEILANGLREAPRPVFDDLTLNLLFLPRVTRAPNQSLVRVKVGPGDLRHFYAPELSRLRRGERVQVSYDPFDPEAPAILTTTDGDYLALAEPWTLQQPDDLPGLREKVRQQMALMKWWREQVQRLRAPLGDVRARVPKISAATKVARAVERADQARPDPGAAERANRVLRERAGIA